MNEASGTSPSAVLGVSPELKPVVPDYELLRRIGCGAYGQVWLVRNKATGVLRAAKIVWRHTFQEERPFEREFEGVKTYEPISREHPSQLALFHVGRNEQEGYFYYVMELADDAAGERSSSYVPHTLREELARGRLPAARVIDVGVALAEALAHLHRHGLVHRDVKPSNVIFVNGRPKLADIGLVTETSELGTILGTEGYLLPEAAGTPQADIFALGKVLYEAATGLHRREFPKLPQELWSSADANQVFELNEILLRACATGAQSRYANVQLMLSDLLLLASGRSVRRTHQLERRLAIAKRTALALLAVMLLGVVPYYLAIKEARRAGREAKRAGIEAQHAKLAEADAKEKLWASYLAQSQALRWSHRPGRRFQALELLKKAAEMRPSLALRNEAIACLALADLRLAKEWAGRLVSDGPVGFDFEHGRYVRSDASGNISVRRIADDTEEVSLPGSSPVLEFSFSPEGRFLMAYFTGTRTTVFDLDDRRRILDLTNFCNRTSDYSWDGKLLAIAELIEHPGTPEASFSGVIHFYSLPDGRELSPFSVTRLPYALRFDSSGRRLAVSFTGSSLVRIFDVATGTLEQEYTFPAAIYGLDWHPSGNWLAVASANGSIYRWNTSGSTNQSTFLGHQSDVLCPRFVRGGTWLASTSWDGTFRLWDTFTSDQLFSIRRPATFFVSSDGGWCGCADEKGRGLGIYEFSGDREVRQLRNEEAPESEAIRTDFHPSGSILATAYRDGLRFWNVATTRQLEFLPIGWVYSIGFVEDGARLLTCTKDGLQEWNFQSDRRNGIALAEPRMLSQPDTVMEVSLSQTGKAAFVQGGKLHLLDLKTRQESAPLAGAFPYMRTTMSSDGRFVVAWGRPADEFQVWETATARLVVRMTGTAEGFALFSPDGHWLVLGDFFGYRILEVESWKPVATVRSDTDYIVRGFAFTPDSRTLAVAHSGTVVELLDVPSGCSLATLETPDPRLIAWLRFSPDGKLLAATSNSHTTHIWDLGLIRRELASMNLDWGGPTQ